MPLVTLIGEKLAKKNNEFIYLGPNNECRNCKLKTVCFNLKKGRKYRIINIRDKRHNCSVHEGNVAVVEIQELPIVTTADRKIMEGTKQKLEPKNCIHIGCNYYDLCNNPAIQKDKECKIEKTLGEINCPIGRELQKVEISY